MMERVLVTGAAGFIGSVLVHRLLDRYPAARVVSLDALTYAARVELLPGPEQRRHLFVKGDVCDRELVEELLHQHQIDTVLHLAAESHVDRSITGPAAFIRTNVEGTSTLLEAARLIWSRQGPLNPATHRFHLVSTDEVFGDLPPDAPASREDDPYRPSSPYAASKAAADHLARAWQRTYGLPVTISHGSNTYGQHQHAEKFIPTVVRKALAGEPIPIYGDGRQVRDWLHVDDHVDGIFAVVDRGKVGRSYNLGGGNERVNLEVAGAICGLLDGLRPEGAPHRRWITLVEDRPGHDRRYALDVGRSREEVGWGARVGWEVGLGRVVAGMVARLLKGA